MSYCFFDLETTGFNIEGNHIVEIGYVICNGLRPQSTMSTSESGTVNKFEIIKQKSIIIKPTNWKVEMTCIHGITQEMAENEGIPFADTIDIWYNDILAYNCINLVGHNICIFDMPFVKRDIRYYNLESHPLYELMYTIQRFDTLLYAEEINLNTKIWLLFYCATIQIMKESKPIEV